MKQPAEADFGRYRRNYLFLVRRACVGPCYLSCMRFLAGVFLVDACLVGAFLADASCHAMGLFLALCLRLLSRGHGPFLCLFRLPFYNRGYRDHGLVGASFACLQDFGWVALVVRIAVARKLVVGVAFHGPGYI